MNNDRCSIFEVIELPFGKGELIVIIIISELASIIGVKRFKIYQLHGSTVQLSSYIGRPRGMWASVKKRHWLKLSGPLIIVITPPPAGEDYYNPGKIWIMSPRQCCQGSETALLWGIAQWIIRCFGNSCIFLTRLFLFQFDIYLCIKILDFFLFKIRKSLLKISMLRNITGGGGDAVGSVIKAMI